jgi:acyl-CoA oxidase
MLAQGLAAHFAVAKARRMFLDQEPGGDSREVEMFAAAAKVFGTDHATMSLQACREACGGQGYLAANRIGPLKSDSDVFTTFEGDNTVLLQLVAKARLSDFKRQFRDSQVLGVLRFITDKAGRHWNQSNPIARRLRSEEHLRSREFVRGALELRESSLVESVARRIQSRTKSGMNVADAFLGVQNHVLAMARATMERLVFDAFADGVAAAEDKQVRAALDQALDLFGLWRIEADVGWFLENDIFESGKATAIRDEVDELIDEVGKNALGFCEAFGIPDECLAAPIAFLDPGERLK